MASPLHTVKSEFGSKEDLVGKLMPLLDRLPEENDNEFKERLLRVSNRKLLKLWSREQSLRSTHGSRESLVDKIVGQRGGDADMRKKLLGASTGRLLDMHKALSRK
jgi:hypothetical protein